MSKKLTVENKEALVLALSTLGRSISDACNWLGSVNEPHPAADAWKKHWESIIYFEDREIKASGDPGMYDHRKERNRRDAAIKELNLAIPKFKKAEWAERQKLADEWAPALIEWLEETYGKKIVDKMNIILGFGQSPGGLVCDKHLRLSCYSNFRGEIFRGITE